MRSLLRDLYLNTVGFLKKPKKGVHIINAHYVTPGISSVLDSVVFESFLVEITKYATLVSLERALELIALKQFNACYIALTFDDGFEECATVIAPLLKKYGATGAFFINANYIDSDIRYQNEFNKRINVFTKKPMSWGQVSDLHKNGHLIGSHNLDHTDMSLLNSNDLEFQLKRNKDILENKLSYQCNYFAWTYGQFNHFPPYALEVTKRYHKHIFSGTNFKCYYSMGGAVINRRHIEPYWDFTHIKYFLSFKRKLRE